MNECNPADSERERNVVRSAAIAAGWMRHLVDVDQIVELRALRVQDGKGKGKDGSTWAGTFKGTEADLALMCRAAMEISGLCSGVYYTLNPLKPDFHVARLDKFRRVENTGTAADRNVSCRRWLLIDCDPRRAKGSEKLSATEAEKAAALAKAEAVRDFLATRDWPAPVLSDSGNGYHLLYRLPDLPFTLPLPESDPVRRTLHALAKQFNDDEVQIDTGVFNPSRIVKFPGTMACKGEHSDARPHRRSRVVDLPANTA